jgi:aspartokinase
VSCYSELFSLPKGQIYHLVEESDFGAPWGDYDDEMSEENYNVRIYETREISVELEPQQMNNYEKFLAECEKEQKRKKMEKERIENRSRYLRRMKKLFKVEIYGDCENMRSSIITSFFSALTYERYNFMTSLFPTQFATFLVATSMLFKSLFAKKFA